MAGTKQEPPHNPSKTMRSMTDWLERFEGDGPEASRWTIIEWPGRRISTTNWGSANHERVEGLPDLRTTEGWPVRSLGDGEYEVQGPSGPFRVKRVI